MQGLGLWPGWLSTEPWGRLSPPGGHCCCSPLGSACAVAGAVAGGLGGLPVDGAGAGDWVGAAEGKAGLGLHVDQTGLAGGWHVLHWGDWA